MFVIATVLLLAWGSLAFGAEYAWAYAPLLVFAVAAGGLGILAGERTFPSRPLAWSLAAVGVCAMLQLVPLSAPALATLSPARTNADFAQLRAGVSLREAEEPSASDRPRTLSIAPSRTVLGLAFLGAFLVLLIGTTRAMSAFGPVAIAQAVVVLGVVVAILEVAQRASGNELVYGLWQAPKRAFSAPFINRNHDGGWIVMVLSLSLGYLTGVVTQGFRHVAPGWRARFLWLSTPRASRAIVLIGASGAMIIAVAATRSRSALACLVFALVTIGAWAVMRQRSASRRTLLAGALLIVLGTAAVWTPLDAVLRRLDRVSIDAAFRLHLWRDALSILHDFPLTGTGLNTFGIAMLNYQTVDDGQLYIEAHNDYLQLAAEGGMLLGIPILAALGLFIDQIRRRFAEGDDDTMTYWLRAGAVTGLCAIALQSTVDFTLQMPGAAVLFVVLAAIAIHRPACSGHGLSTSADGRRRPTTRLRAEV